MKAFGNVYNGARVLITGHTGFKGSWLTAWLSHLGAEIHGYSIDLLDPPSHYEKGQFESLSKSSFCDIRDIDAITEVVSDFRPDFIFHLAAQAIVAKSYQSPLDTFQVNALGTAHLLEAARLCNHDCSIVVVTSDKCYQNKEWEQGYRETDRLGGSDPYSASKASAEIVASSFHQSFFSKQESNVRMATGRAGNVIGGGDWAANRIIPDAVRAITKGDSIFIRSPQSTRPWQHVLEPLSGYLRLGQCLRDSPSEIVGESFNFGPSEEEDFSVERLLNEFLKHWQLDHNPIETVEEKGFREQSLLKLNCGKSEKILDWTPTLGFANGVRYTADWYRGFEISKNAQTLTMVQIQDYMKEAGQLSKSWTGNESL